MTKQVYVAGHVDQLESKVEFAPMKISTLETHFGDTFFSIQAKYNPIWNIHGKESERIVWVPFYNVMFFFLHLSLFDFSFNSIFWPLPIPPPNPTHLILQTLPLFWGWQPLLSSYIIWRFISCLNQCGSIKLSVIMTMFSVVQHNRY